MVGNARSAMATLEGPRLTRPRPAPSRPGSSSPGALAPPASRRRGRACSPASHSRSRAGGPPGDSSRAVTGPRARGRKAGLDRVRELVGAHRRGARRLEAERRADRRAARATGGSRLVGRDDAPPSRICSRPASSRMRPVRAPATCGAEAGQWGGSRVAGPAAGATSRNGMTNSSSATHRIASTNRRGHPWAAPSQGGTSAHRRAPRAP